MYNVTFTKQATESKIENAVFDAARANELRAPVTLENGVTVEFVEMIEGHIALVKRDGNLIGTAMVDEFDC